MQYKNIIKLIGLQGLNEKFIAKNIEASKDKEIIVYMETKKQKTCCPKCGNITEDRKDDKDKDLGHGYIFGNKCIINLKYIRYKCKCCNSTFYEDISELCTKYKRHTNASILSVMDNLKNARSSVKEISKNTGMDYRFINELIALEVGCKGLGNITELPENIGIDEFKGNMKVLINGKRYKIKYQIQITDLDTGKVVALLPIKDNKCIEEFLSGIKNRKEVKTVAIDMSMQFKRTFLDYFKNCKIIIDYFHVTKLVTTAVDNIRLELWRKYSGDKSKEAKEIKKYLKSLKHLLLTDYEACTNESYKNKIDTRLNEVFAHLPELKLAYEGLQTFYDIKRKKDPEDKVNVFKSWFNNLLTNNIGIYDRISRTIHHWYRYILNSYRITYSNGTTEGNNNLIKVLKRVSFGFGNFENAKNRILLYC